MLANVQVVVMVVCVHQMALDCATQGLIELICIVLLLLSSLALTLTREGKG